MKLTKAQQVQICSGCKIEIKEREQYYATAYNSYCITCGTARLANNNHKLNDKCKFCEDQATCSIEGIPTCKPHIGNALENL